MSAGRMPRSRLRGGRQRSGWTSSPGHRLQPTGGCDAVIVAWVGTSGWSYDHWQGVLYPPGTPRAKRLDLYMREFDTVELNASHYR